MVVHALRRGLAACAGAFALCGCTVVHVHQAGQPQWRVLPGVSQVIVTPDERGLAYISSQTLGLSIGPHSGSFGYVRERTFVVAPGAGCRLVLVDPTTADVQALHAALSRAGVDPRDVCTTNLQKEKPQ